MIGSDDPGGVTLTLMVYVPGCKVGKVSPDWPLKQNHIFLSIHTSIALHGINGPSLIIHSNTPSPVNINVPSEIVAVAI